MPMLMGGCSITDLERRRLEALVADTRRRLTPQPAERRSMAVILAKLLAAFPAQTQSDAPAAQRVEAYFEALSDVPLEFVDDARREVTAGRAPECGGTWAPTPPQFAAVCRRLMQAERMALARVERLLAAKPYAEVSSDERKRVSAGLDKLKADLAALSLTSHHD